jgi:hypothetical protein
VDGKEIGNGVFPVSGRLRALYEREVRIRVGRDRDGV